MQVFCEDPSRPHESLLLAKRLLLGKTETVEGLVASLASLFGLAPAAPLALLGQRAQSRSWSRVVLEYQSKEELLAACWRLKLRVLG